jgi:acetyltransferase-like isoleucine patch superfamily enzyme
MFQRIKIKFYVITNIFIFKKVNVSFGEKLRIRGPVKLFVNNSAKLTIGDNFTLVSGLMLNPLGRNIKSMLRVDDNAELIIGNSVGMSCVSIWAQKSIKIGNHVKLGAGVIVMDSDMHTLDYELRRDPSSDAKNTLSKAIVISDDVFIGVNSIITKGVVIGERSIVAAGSVVVKSIPANEIWGGNPAQFIKRIN